MAENGFRPSDASQKVGSDAMILINQVKKAYRTAAGDFWALQGITLEILRGEYVLIVGKSGAGKTTLTNMVTGVDRLSAGEVLVGGTRVHDLGENQQAL